MSHAPTRTIEASAVSLPAGSRWRMLPFLGGALGIAGVGGALALGGGHRAAMYFSFLTSFLFWLSLSLGGLFFVLVHFATKAGWSVVVRRIAESLMGTLPLLVLPFFLIVVMGMHELYHWTHAEAAHDPILQSKAAYLNEGAFKWRALIYFGLWSALSGYYLHRSWTQDRTGDPRITRRLQNLSYPALLLFALSISFAAFDWIMSLDPHWFSTIFGVYYFSGSVMATYSFLILVLLGLRSGGVLRDIVTVEHYHDLGKLMFGFMVFWTYIAFSQYFLIWYANIPEETIFFSHRMTDGWKGVSGFLMIGHFAVPFFFLMSRHIKRNPFTLCLGAAWILLVHLIDMYWLVMPNFEAYRHGWHPSVADAALLVCALAGVGGLFLAGFGWFLRNNPLVPVRDPRLPESLAFENF